MILTTLVVYMVVLLCAGFWANKRIHGMTDFLLAGRRLGLLLTSGALAATHFGGGMVMGGGEYGFIYGLSGAWYGISCGVGLIFLAFLTAGKFRHLSLYTIPDYLEQRYNSKTRPRTGSLAFFNCSNGDIGGTSLISSGSAFNPRFCRQYRGNNSHNHIYCLHHPRRIVGCDDN
jgi:SSS family solute:Na+ symporter